MEISSQTIAYSPRSTDPGSPTSSLVEIGLKLEEFAPGAPDFGGLVEVPKMI